MASSFKNHRSSLPTPNPGDERIWRANLNGSDVQQVVLDSGFVTRLTVDIAAGKLYWAGSGIKRANLDGSAVETILAGPGTV